MDDWRRWFSPGVTYLAIDDNDDAVGLVVGFVSQEPGVADLMSMWVHPNNRGTGVGDDLVRALVAWSEAEHRRLRLHVVDGNAPAIALYQRHGFRVTGDITVRENGVHELEMARTAT